AARPPGGPALPLRRLQGLRRRAARAPGDGGQAGRPQRRRCGGGGRPRGRGPGGGAARGIRPAGRGDGRAGGLMTLAELCVKRAVFAVMLIAFLGVLGIFSFRDLGVDLFPRADPATVNINVKLPGATPEEMTTQVVLPLEEALSTISGMDEMMSQATAGNARINCQFVLERDIESASQDVREKVAGALRNLPPNILPPVIQKADPDADPVLTLVVAGDKSLRETTEIADKRIKRVLE